LKGRRLAEKRMRNSRQFTHIFKLLVMHFGLSAA
jgi:hypothetical protein